MYVTSFEHCECSQLFDEEYIFEYTAFFQIVQRAAGVARRCVTQRSRVAPPLVDVIDAGAAQLSRLTHTALPRSAVIVIIRQCVERAEGVDVVTVTQRQWLAFSVKSMKPTCSIHCN